MPKKRILIRSTIHPNRDATYAYSVDGGKTYKGEFKQMLQAQAYAALTAFQDQVSWGPTFKKL